MIGSLWLNAMRVSLLRFLLTTACTHMGLYLFTFKSKTWTFPSLVTAANTVLEYGAHSTSPTAHPKSNTKSGSLEEGNRMFVHGGYIKWMTENENLFYRFLLNIPVKYFILYISSVTKCHLFAGAVLVLIHCLSKQLHEGTSRLMIRNWNSCSKKKVFIFQILKFNLKWVIHIYY